MNFATFINRFFSRDDAGTSKNVAKERLRLVLVHDRLDVSEKVMNDLRVDLISVIGKYFGIDEKALEVSLSRETDGMALVANIPIRRQKVAAGDDTEDEATSAGAVPESAAASEKQPSEDGAETPTEQEPAAKQSGSKQGAGKKPAKAKQPHSPKPQPEQVV